MGTSSLLGALVGLLRGDMSEHLEAVKLSAPPISPGAGIHAGVGPSLIQTLLPQGHRSQADKVEIRAWAHT